MDKKNTMDSVKEFWKSKSTTTKRTMIASSVLLVVLIGSLIYLYTKDSYDFLLSTSDSAVSANVISQLKERNIKYDVKGESIYVSGVNTDALKLELSGEGYLESTDSSIELFSSPLFISEKQENTLIQKDLENNIKSAIKSYNEIADANVILTMGTQSSFKNDNVPASAAIQLKLKTNLSSKQVKSIQEFVAAAVPNLSSSDVVITDTNNNLLSSNAENNSIEDNTAYVLQIEDKISSQISELLSSAFPTTGFKVVSRVTVNFDETKIEKETVSSGPDTIVSHETYSEVTKDGTSNTTAGTESNVPSYETPTADNNASTEIKSEIINYELNTTKEQTTKQPEITNINVAVIADKSLSAVDTEKIRDLVETASGYNEERGDKVSIQGFDAETTEEAGEGFVGFVKNNFESISNKFLMLAILIAVVIIALRLLGLFKKEQTTVEVESISTLPTIPNENNGEEGNEPIVISTPESPEMLKKKELLRKEIDDNPQQVASVFKTWLDKEHR